MSDEEIVELIDRILDGQGGDKLISKWNEMLKKATGCPEILDLIRESEEPETAADILAKARQYKPIQMPPPAEH